MLESALDVSYFLAFGLARNLEASLLASPRSSVRRRGRLTSHRQSAAALSHNAVRDPRIGVAPPFADALAGA